MASVIDTRDSETQSDESPRRKMSLKEFNAIAEEPEWDRMLIRGELWEKPMTKRNRWHARVEARIAHLLHAWLEQESEQQGEVFSGEVGCDIPDLETGFGIDVAYFSEDVLSQQAADSRYIVGPPILAVEILSPSEQKEEIDAKIQAYLDAGVKAIWIVDYRFQTVVLHRPDESPRMFSGNETLSADPYLPGFSVALAKLFQR